MYSSVNPYLTDPSGKATNAVLPVAAKEVPVFFVNTNGMLQENTAKSGADPAGNARKIVGRPKQRASEFQDVKRFGRFPPRTFGGFRNGQTHKILLLLRRTTLAWDPVWLPGRPHRPCWDCHLAREGRLAWTIWPTLDARNFGVTPEVRCPGNMRRYRARQAGAVELAGRCAKELGKGRYIWHDG